ncbi:uncharacterized protein [Henckelia pumila]|uniref:uncharacterized protein n=1 Tax=Henckelia pumila TaxID=405737 RepID=UPI003C6E5792
MVKRFECLMDRATKIFNVLLLRASRMPRNFIIDQTNVYKSARKRKLKPFADHTKIAVVVFPRPEEHKLRAKKTLKETGKEVPGEAVNEMLGNYTLPTSKDIHSADEYFDQVLFVDRNREESQRFLDEMKRVTRMKQPMSSKLDIPSPMSYFRTFTPHCLETPVQSDSGVSFQQDVGDPGGSSYFNQNQSRSLFGNYYDSRCDFDRRRSCSGYGFNKINPYQSRGPAHGSVDRFFQSYQGKMLTNMLALKA